MRVRNPQDSFYHRLLEVTLTTMLVPALGVPQTPSAAGVPAREPLTSLSSLPHSCRSSERASRQINELIRVLAARPAAEGYNALGALYAQGNELACAIAAFRQSLRLDPASWQTRYNLALALQSRGDSAGAVDELRIVLRQSPGSFAAHNALGLALRSLGHVDAATDEFKNALKINPKFAYAALNLAELAIEQKRYAAAIYYLQQALAYSPPPELAHELEMNLAVAYSNTGKYDEAAALFRKLVSVQPKSAQLHFNLATVYAHHDQYAEAADEYGKALQLDPADDSARLSLTKALLILNQVEESLPHLLKYTQHKPADPEGYELLGQAYRKLGRFEEAISALHRAVAMNRRSYDARYNLGFTLARAGKTDEAIEQLKQATDLKPDASEALYELGILLSKKNQPEAAETEFQAFQRLKEKSNAGFLNNQANRLLEEGRTQEAVESYRRTLALAPENARFHYNLSLALSRLGDHAGEQNELETAIKLDNNLSEAHNQLGVIYMAQGALAEAERQFKTAIAIDPRYAEAQSNLGTTYGREGKNSQAITLFRQAIDNNPQYAQAFINLGLTLAAQGNYTEAEQQLQTALRFEPASESALTALGMLQARVNRGRESVQTFQKVTALHPDSADAHLSLGIALADQFDLQDALREFSEAIRLAPNSAGAHYNKGRLLYDLNRREEARWELETAVRLSPNHTSALYMLAALEGSSARSTELLQRVIALEPRNAEAHYLLGRNLLHQGQTDAAIQHWKLAVEADPDNSSALYNLARTSAQLHDPEAKQYAERLEALQKRRQLTDRVQQLNNFALEAANAHGWPQAVEQLQEAIKLCGQCPQLAVLHKNFGLIYARQGELGNAKRELRLALQLHPDDEDARRALEILASVSKGPPSP